MSRRSVKRYLCPLCEEPLPPSRLGHHMQDHNVAALAEVMRAADELPDEHKTKQLREAIAYAHLQVRIGAKFAQESWADDAAGFDAHLDATRKAYIVRENRGEQE